MKKSPRTTADRREWFSEFEMTRAYDDIIEYIAGGSTPSDVVGFRPSEEAQARVADLLERQKNNLLGPEEQSELDHYLHFEHLMRLAKPRARQ